MINEKKNLIVTTPKSEMENSAKEAQELIKSGGGYYFRTFKKKPKGLEVGSKIYYVEDGYIRGFGEVGGLAGGEMRCEITDREYGDSEDERVCHAIIPACSWKWIKPVAMKGFQGFRYFDDSNVEVVGRWMDTKPEVS